MPVTIILGFPLRIILAFGWLHKLKEEIQRMIHEEMIEEATGASWVSPVHIVYKGNGELRLCADLREANKGVIQERFLLRQLSGEKMFSTLELAVVYGLTPKEHWKNLQAMLDTLRASGLRLNAKKLNRCGEKLCAD